MSVQAIGEPTCSRQRFVCAASASSGLSLFSGQNRYAVTQPSSPGRRLDDAWRTGRGGEIGGYPPPDTLPAAEIRSGRESASGHDRARHDSGVEAGGLEGLEPPRG